MRPTILFAALIAVSLTTPAAQAGSGAAATVAAFTFKFCPHSLIAGPGWLFWWPCSWIAMEPISVLSYFQPPSLIEAIVAAGPSPIP